MRPLISALFVFSLFGVFAAHIANGILNQYLKGTAPELLAAINEGLRSLLIQPFGNETSVYVLLCAGAFFSLWAYLAEASAQQGRRQERFSTW